MSAPAASTLYFGNLSQQVEQESLYNLCDSFGRVEQVKIIRDKLTGLSAGYGFVTFAEKNCAEQALQALQGKVLWGLEIRVNWAVQSYSKEDTSEHYHLFVGDLAQEVNDTVLFNAFSGVGSCSDARVMWDNRTGKSKGYGFVSFRHKEDAQAALHRMEGQLVGSRRIRCGWAQHKHDDSILPMTEEAIHMADLYNRNVYVGNIPPDSTDQSLRVLFSEFGKVASVKINKKGCYGFVKFEKHADAVRAILNLHGKNVKDRRLKCSWGKSISTLLSPPNQMPLMMGVLPQIHMGPSPLMTAGMMFSPRTSMGLMPLMMQPPPAPRGLLFERETDPGLAHARLPQHTFFGYNTFGVPMSRPYDYPSSAQSH